MTPVVASLRQLAAEQPGYLSAYNIVATIGLALILAGLVPLVLRLRNLSGLPPWADRFPTWAFVASLAAGLAADVVAYGVLL